MRCKKCYEPNPLLWAIIISGTLVLVLPYIAPIVGAILLFYLAIKFFEKNRKNGKKV